MSRLSLDFSNLKSFISEKDLEAICPKVLSCHEMLENGQGLGSHFLGWKKPGISKTVLTEINEVAKSVRELCQVFIVIGIGGSYIGSQAGITFLKSSFPNQL